MNLKKGISASPGVAIGPALVLDTEEYRIPRRTTDASGVPGQLRILDGALAAARQEVAELRLATARKFGTHTAEILAFHEAVISDPGLRKNVVAMVESQNTTAAYAFSQEMNRRQREFLAAADTFFKQRVTDLYDIEKRVLRHILGREREGVANLTEPVVIIAHDLTPSQAIQMANKQQDHVLGIAVDVGGATSHMAIIARQLNIPTVVGLGNITTLVAGGETVIVDGTHGIVVTNPDAESTERYRAQQKRHRAIEKELLGQRDLPAVTQDGVKINLLANIELAEETRHAVDYGAEGIGLYRSEFLFLAGDRLPTEEQQYQVFRGAVRHARGRPIVIRTIDLGADKMSDYLGSNHEHNPVLGLRSIRYCLHHLDMFKTHLRAILRASADGDVRIMFPMITTLMEIRQARSTLQDVMEDLAEDGFTFRRDVPVGMMVETPAAAMLSEAFVREVAFMSIGTNDLTQYSLAVDRGNERVAYLYAAHNPAVLRLIRMVVQAGAAANVPVTICGEMAGEPIYCQLLLGLGMRTLSMAPQDIPEIKKIIRTTTMKKCESIARAIRKFDEDRQVFNYLRDQMRSVDPESL